MGLLKWLTGAANRSAKNNKRSGGGQKKKKQKQRQEPRRQREPSRSSQPKSSGRQTTRSGGGSRQTSRGSTQRQTSTFQPKTFQPRTFKPSATQTQTRYKSFQASNVAPRAFKASTAATNKKTDTKPKVKGAITKTTVGQTQRSEAHSVFEKPKNYNYKKDLQQAYKKGSKTTYLGTKQKETTKALIPQYEQNVLATAQTHDAKKKYYKSDDWKTTKKTLAKQTKKAWYKAARKAGYSDEEAKAWMTSEEGKKTIKDDYLAEKNRIKKSINKELKTSISKDIKDTYNLKSVNALTKGQFDKMTTASRMGKKLGNKYLKSVGGEKLLEDIGSKTVEAGLRSKAAYGAMQGMSKADIWSGSVGKYNKAARTGMEQTKKSGAYLAGYGIGLAADMGMGGVASRGASLAEGAGKIASKLTAKGVSKEAAEELAKEAGKVATKEGWKRFGKNRAGQLAAETPTNILDAAKMSMDADGKVNKKEFRNWLLLDSAFTVGVGGAMEGIGAAATKRLGNKTLELMAKKEAGNITEEELAQLQKNVRKLTKKGDAEIKTLASDIAGARVKNIEARSAASAKATAEAEAQNVPKGFHGRGSRYTQSPQAKGARARANYAEKLAENDQRVATRAKMMADEQARTPGKATTEAEKKALAQASQRYSEGVASTTERARVNEVHRLQDEIRTLREALPKAEAKSESTGTFLSHARAEARADEIRKSIKIKEEQLKNAQANTLSGRLGKAQAEVRKEGTFASHEKAARNLEKVEGEVKADAEAKLKRLQNAAKKAEAKAKADPSPTNIARAEVAKEAAEKAAEDARTAAREETPKPKAEAPKTKVETPAESTPSSPSKETKRLQKKYDKAEKEYTAAQETYERTDKEAGKAYNEWKAAEEAGHTERAKTLRDKYFALRNHKEYLGNEADKLKVKRDEARKAYDDSMSYAKIDDDGKFPSDPQEKIKAVEEKSEAELGILQKPPKMEGGVINAETKGAKMPLLQKFREMFVSNEAALEDIAQKLPGEERKSFLAAINEFRRSVKTGRAIVAEQGRSIYKEFGLTTRGAKVEAKRNDFEEYCFLLHELDRKKQGNNFTNKSREEINARLEELRNQYAIVNKDGEVIGSEVENFQKDIRNYFRKLLGREVDAGITTAEDAKKFMEMYPNYVPTYKPSEFEQILTKRTSEEINVGKGIKAATGGEHDLVPLYNQMQVKTNAVMKRTELNKVLNMLCKASGTSEKELDGILPWFKDMSGEQKAEALMDTQVFTKQKDGKHIATMYYNGTPVDISIDKEVFDCIRRWSGEDRKLVTLSRLLDNRALGAVASQFKKWITDYNLIFGVKNLKRDLATALFYTTDRVGFMKNLPKGMAVSMLPDSMLPKNLKVYKQAYQVYKENGGVISQFIARDSASDAFFDTANKYNPFKLVENFNSAMETIPRMTEFISTIDSKAVKAAGKNGNYEFEFRKLLNNKKAVSDAMYRAKDVTLNFDRAGWLGAKLNRGLIPFFNPAIQGISKLGRTVVTDNIKYGKNFKLNPGETMGSFLKMGVALTGMMAVPAVVWDKAFGDYINGKVDGYEKQSDYNRYANYLLPIGDGKFIKIPKARELATLQAPIDFAYDNMQFGSGNKWERLFSDGSERDLLSMAKIAVEQTGPLTPWSDSLFMPIYNTAKNKTWYGGKIESGADDIAHREAGEYSKIWDEKTSATAKWIGGKFNISPKKVDNVLDSYLGVIYDMGISQTAAKNDFRQVAKEEGKLKGLAQLTRTPWGNAFVIDSVFSNANKSDYYDYADKREKKLADMKEGSDEYIKAKAEMTKDKTSFSYTSTSYDELQAQIWLSKDLTMSQKKKYARMLKQGDNLLWNERKDGKKVPSKDPLSVIWNMRDGNGKRIMSTQTMLESCSFTTKNGSNTITDAYETYGKLGGKSATKFMEVTLAARDVQRAAGDSLSMPRWETVAYTNQLNHIKGSDKVLASYIEDDKKRESLKANAKIYEDYGGDKKAYYGMKRTITQGAYNLGYDYPTEMRDGELTMILSTHRTKAGKKYRDLEYQPNGTYILDNRMNAGRCLDTRLNSKYGQKKLKAFCDKYKLNPSDGKNWTDDDLKKVCKAIEKEYKGEDKELWAAKFIVITGKPWKNPYGEIGDYSLDSDTGVYCSDAWKPWGHRRRRGRRGRRRHGWGHGGGGGGGTPFNPEVNTAGKNAKVTATKVTDTTARVKAKKSNLNDAYRKKVKKLREETRSIK